jgi:hypothetical protein
MISSGNSRLVLRHIREDGSYIVDDSRLGVRRGSGGR